MQQGYKIEYVAAADAYTSAPQTFAEFFYQRRRWISSTLVNMVNMLSDWRTIVLANDNISFLYIVYQFLLIISNILGEYIILEIVVM